MSKKERIPEEVLAAMWQHLLKSAIPRILLEEAERREKNTKQKNKKSLKKPDFNSLCIKWKSIILRAAAPHAMKGIIDCLIH